MLSEVRDRRSAWPVRLAGRSNILNVHNVDGISGRHRFQPRKLTPFFSTTYPVKVANPRPDWTAVSGYVRAVHATDALYQANGVPVDSDQAKREIWLAIRDEFRNWVMTIGNIRRKDALAVHGLCRRVVHPDMLACP